jgi:drug/metabolite transporter (DMT)-like permease
MRNRPLRAELICIAVVALMWGGYPLLARSSGVGTPFGALILTAFALVPIAIATIWSGQWVRPVGGDLGRLIAAGVLMGIGTAAFNYVVNSRQMEASVAIPIIDTLMLLVSVIGAIALFAEPITTKKVLGVALLVAGIVVLKPE